MSKRIIHNEASKEHAKADIEALNPDKRWVMSLAEEKDNKSLAQNRLYWKWVTIIGNEIGNFKDEQDVILRQMHGEPKFVSIDGDGVNFEYRKTISQLNVAEMSELLTKVSYWAGSEGIILPHPDDQGIRE